MAASVAFPLMIYSSANLCCFKVSFIYHQLLSVILHTKKTAILSCPSGRKYLVVCPLAFGAGETSIKACPDIIHKGGHMKKYTCFKLFTYTVYHASNFIFLIFIHFSSLFLTKYFIKLFQPSCM